MSAYIESAATEESAWEAVAREKLVRVPGPNQGLKIFQEVMLETGLPQLSSADDLRRFADHLEHRGGFIRALSVVLKTHALLRGAR